MMTRRNFVNASLATLGLASTRQIWAENHHAIGVQLYTVRTEAEKDLPAVLKEIQRIGYKEVEPYWNVYNRPAAELRRLIEDHGLRVPSGHFNYDGLEQKLDYAAALGVQYVTCPMLPTSQWTSMAGFQKAAVDFNRWGQMARDRGMTLAFHNHNYEFQNFGATNGYDELLAHTDPSLVKLEIDCYWITQAGRDPVQTIRQLKGRVKMLHLKDRVSGFATSQWLDASAEHFTEVGSGTIDWKEVLRAANECGVEHFFVERDSGQMNAMESLSKSYGYLQPLM
jgi:sugar phosphate isomerase/epimerase